MSYLEVPKFFCRTSQIVVVTSGRPCEAQSRKSSPQPKAEIHEDVFGPSVVENGTAISDDYVVCLGLALRKSGAEIGPGFYRVTRAISIE